MWKLRRRLALAFLSLAVQTAAPAWADPPAWSGAWQVHERYHRSSADGADAPIAYVPDPTQLSDDFVPLARGLPYGFNRGTCDRALLDGPAEPGVLPDGAVGRAMDRGDRECLWGALENLPDDRPIAWEGENGTLFRIIAERTYMIAGAPCRDWRASAAQSGRSQRFSGTFCRRSDGQWVAAR